MPQLIITPINKSFKNKFMIFIWKFLSTWSVLETTFYIYHRIHKRHYQKFSREPKQLQLKNKEQRKQIIQRLLNFCDVNKPGDRGAFKQFLRGWFLRSPLSEIKRGNIFKLFAWFMFYDFPSRLTTKKRKEVNSILNTIQEETKLQFNNNNNNNEYSNNNHPELTNTFQNRINVFQDETYPNTKCIRLNLDECKTSHRPLAVYALIGAINWVSRYLLGRRNFTRKSISNFKYWHRKPTPQQNKTTNDDPIFIFHGLGHGLIHYIGLLDSPRLKNREIIILELPHISIRIFESHYQPTEVSDITKIILNTHGYRQAVFVGHSFGTFCLTWCIKYQPEIIKSILLIDPTCLMLGIPKTAYQFLYTDPNSWYTKFQRFWFGREPGIAREMYRNFWWQCNSLFIEDIPSSTYLKSNKSNESKSKHEHEIFLKTGPFETKLDIASACYDSSGTTLDTDTKSIRDVISFTNTNNTNTNTNNIKIKVAIVLDGRDQLVPSAAIIRYLAVHGPKNGHNSSNLRILYFPENTHSNFMFDSYARREIMALVPWLCE